jgi:hypothetical protein
MDKALEVFVSYNGGIKPDTSDFESISVRHESQDFSYIVGKINLARLAASSWVSDPNASVILTEKQEF